MSPRAKAIRVDGLLVLLLAYCAASLFHYAHNAAFLDQYPNMPAWLSPARVCVAWVGVTLVGLAGYALVRRGYRIAGLIAVAVYGALGLDVLGHYGLAPLSAHTPIMHLTIGLEAATALLLLITVLKLLTSRVPSG